MRSPSESSSRSVRAGYLALALGGDVHVHACAVFQNALHRCRRPRRRVLLVDVMDFGDVAACNRAARPQRRLSRSGRTGLHRRRNSRRRQSRYPPSRLRHERDLFRRTSRSFPPPSLFRVRRHASMLASTASGAVKSITTSTSRRFCSRQPRGIFIHVRVDDLDSVSALACDFGDQRAGLARPQHHQFQRSRTQSNTSGSTSVKNLACSLRTASGTSASSMTNVRLISDAPCEIMRTLMSLIA